MATMKTLNGYGFNATELNGKTSDNYLKKTDTASDSKKLGGKAPEYYIHPRNLLDNSDFTNPVNQRGKTNYNSEGYTIDRWNLSHIGSGVSITDGGITIKKSSSLVVFEQILSEDVRKRLIGKTVTFAAKTSDGEIKVANATVGEMGTNLDAYGPYFAGGLYPNIYHNANLSNLELRILASSTSSDTTFEWAALYEGSYTADTLPPYVPKGYAAELAECQRYYYQSWIGSNVKQLDGIIICEAINTSKVTNVVFPQTMRSNPTVTLYAPLTGNTGKVAEFVTDSEVNTTTIYKTKHRFTLASGANEFEAGKHYYLHYSASADLL